MRVLLYTGKGGAGTTTVAAATAAHAAASGTKTLLLSTGSGASLPPILGAGVSGDPVEVEPALFAMHTDARAGAEGPSGFRACVQELVGATTADPVLAGELAAIPGADDVLALLELRDQIVAGRWDLLVVDAGPVAQALRLLALPERLQWCLARVLPVEARIARALRATAGRGGPSHVGPVAAVDRLASELAEIRSVLGGPAVSARLVLTPGTVAVTETRRATTALALYGYRVDGVVANRVLDEQRLAEVRRSFCPLPVAVVPSLDTEPLGPGGLAEIARLLYPPGDADLLAPPDVPAAMVVEASGGELVLDLGLPLVDRRDVHLSRHGDELVIDAGEHRRRLPLPAALRRCVVVGASLRSGRLRVRFEPDPALWRPL